MVEERNRQSGRPRRHDEGPNVDYSYNQWRQAQMQQLVTNNAVALERDWQSMSGENGSQSRKMSAFAK